MSFKPPRKPASLNSRTNKINKKHDCIGKKLSYAPTDERSDYASFYYTDDSKDGQFAKLNYLVSTIPLLYKKNNIK